MVARDPSNFAQRYLDQLNQKSNESKIKLDNTIRGVPQLSEINGLDDLLYTHTLAIALIDKTRDLATAIIHNCDNIYQARLKEKDLLLRSGLWAAFKGDEVFQNFSLEPLQSLKLVIVDFKKGMKEVFFKENQSNINCDSTARTLTRKMRVCCQDYRNFVQELIKEAVDSAQCCLQEPKYEQCDERKVATRSWNLFYFSLILMSGSLVLVYLSAKLIKVWNL